MTYNHFQFISSDTPIDYNESVFFMENRVADIKNNIHDETIWFLQHPPLYTAGTSANDFDLIDKNRFPVYHTGRGGQYTYHGPGQLIAYIMLNIQMRQIGIREYIAFLEKTIIDTLGVFNIHGMVRKGRVGVWVCDNNTESKIAAIGVRVRRGVTYHGVAININPDLSAFDGIIPCGINEYGVTSLRQLGIACTDLDIQTAFKNAFIININQISKDHNSQD
jgi:lipoyl(octanoyl) transferase